MPIQPADPNVEYILVYHHPVWEKDPKKIRVPKGTIVNNVKYKSAENTLNHIILGGGTQLEFTVKETGEIFNTNYGYMFALNTPKNIKCLAKVEKLQALRDKAEYCLRLALNEIELVAGPFEGVFTSKKNTEM